MSNSTRHSMRPASGADGARPRTQKLVLWDVDLTLVEIGHLGRELYAAAFQIVTGCPMRVQSPPAGRLDPDIFQATVKAHGLTSTDYPFARFADALAVQYSTHREELTHHGRALPGAADAMAMLARNPVVVQTVVTGNIMPVARVKLAAFGLDRYVDFDVGAYGSEGSTRAELVELARQRAVTKYSLPLDQSHTVLIGDSRHDMVAGSDSGIAAVGVTTGRDTANELLNAGATHILSDLRDTSAVVRSIFAGGSAAGT